MVKHHGGLAIVQDPKDAIIPGMPQRAIQSVDVDYVVPAADAAKPSMRGRRRQTRHRRSSERS